MDLYYVGGRRSADDAADIDIGLEGQAIRRGRVCEASMATDGDTGESGDLA